MDIEIGGDTFHKKPNLLEEIAYRDTWGHGADSFIAMIYERLILMRDLMHKREYLCSLRLAGEVASSELFWTKSLEPNIFEMKSSGKDTSISAKQDRISLGTSTRLVIFLQCEISD